MDITQNQLRLKLIKTVFGIEIKCTRLILSKIYHNKIFPTCIKFNEKNVAIIIFLLGLILNKIFQHKRSITKINLETIKAFLAFFTGQKSESH